MTLYDMCDRLLRAGMQKERGLLSDLRDEMYRGKGDETGINVKDVQRVKALYNAYFRSGQLGDNSQTRAVSRKQKRG